MVNETYTIGTTEIKFRPVELDFDHKLLSTCHCLFGVTRKTSYYILKCIRKKDDDKRICYHLLEIHKTLDGYNAICGSNFYYDYSGLYKVIGICKINFEKYECEDN